MVFKGISNFDGIIKPGLSDSVECKVQYLRVCRSIKFSDGQYYTYECLQTTNDLSKGSVQFLTGIGACVFKIDLHVGIKTLLEPVKLTSFNYYSKKST